MAENLLTLTFVHPTIESKTVKVELGAEATPKYIVDQLVESGFMPAAASDARYKIRRDASGEQLLDEVSLKVAGVGTGESLSVSPTVTGAY